MADEVTVITTPTSEQVDDEGEITWESALSEIKDTLAAGFSGLRESFQSELATLRQSNSDLLTANTLLTGQITEANRNLMEKLTSLTPPASPPEITIVETPPTDTPSLEDEETAPLVEPVEETPPMETRRKRRTL